jgi:hypothetical protein
MPQITQYVKPELLVVAIVLYFLGTILKKSKTVADKYIPICNGVVGIILCTMYLLGTAATYTMQDCLIMGFTAITQGILVAGLSTYVNQLIKQGTKKTDDVKGE